MSPRATRRKPLAPNSGTIDDPVDPITPPTEEDGAELPFSTQLKRYSETEWDRLLLYVYRLEPRVKNSDGPAYIDKYSRPIDEGEIKSTHGGGKYLLWLKDTATDETVRKHTIYVAGAPILQPSQVIQGNPSAPAGVPSAGTILAPGQAPQSEGALDKVVGLLERTLGDLKRDQPTQEQANKILMDTFAQAQRLSMEMLAKQQGADAGGQSAVMSKMFEFALAKMTTEKDPIVELKNMMEVMKLVKGDAPAQPASDPLGTLKVLKDATGLDLKEIIDLKNENAGDGSAWQTAAVNALPGIVDAVPKVFEQLNHGKRIELEIQRTQLQREQIQLRAMEIQRGLPPSAPVQAISAASPPPGTPQAAAAPLASVPPLDPPPATTGAGAASAAPATPAANPAEAEMNELAALVVRCFRNNYPGDQTAEIAEAVFPRLVDELAPNLVDAPVVDMIMHSHPVLAQISADARYTKFRDEFIDYFTGEPDEEEQLNKESAAPAAV